MKAPCEGGRRQRHNTRLRRRISRLEREIEAHAAVLARQQWGQLCGSLNGHMGCKKTWHLLRHLLDPGSSKSAARKQLARIIHQYPGTDEELLEELITRYINTSHAQSSTEQLPQYTGTSNEQLDADISESEGTYSIVLMAVVDSACKYVLIDVGAEGRQSDGGIFKNSRFRKALTNGNLNIPSLCVLPGTTTAVPYVLVGDEAFQLRRDFMRPFPAKYLEDERRVFNYRLSRARRCAENAFGITAARWRILLRTINLKPRHVDYVVKAACVLHNFLTVHNPLSEKFNDHEDIYGNVVAGQWRRGIPDEVMENRVTQFFALENTKSRNFESEAARARNLYTAFFCSKAGEVPWQWAQPGVSKEGALKHLQEQNFYDLQ
ncbi:hypothetical protein MTO96_017957 [Rhipicephalus appendiculatus]